jgi:hypothetical protein
MCLACEQDAIWLAYLESQGLLKPDDPEAVEALFGPFPVQPVPVQGEATRAKVAPSSVSDPNSYFCDDPKAG